MSAPDLLQLSDADMCTFFEKLRDWMAALSEGEQLVLCELLQRALPSDGAAVTGYMFHRGYSPLAPVDLQIKQLLSGIQRYSESAAGAQADASAPMDVDVRLSSSFTAAFGSWGGILGGTGLL